MTSSTFRRAPLVRDYSRSLYVTRRNLRRHHGPVTRFVRRLGMILGLI